MAGGGNFAEERSGKVTRREQREPPPSLETQRVIVAEIEAKRRLVEGNRELIAGMEAKIAGVLARSGAKTVQATAPPK
jgi:hypothetical protein